MFIRLGDFEMDYRLFWYLALVSVLSSVVILIFIIGELQKRGVKINFFLLRLLIPKYVHQYKKMTLDETGSVGQLFYWWVGTINITWILFLIGLVLKA